MLLSRRGTEFDPELVDLLIAHTDEVLGDLDGVDAWALAINGCPDLMHRHLAAGGRFLVCPFCFNARQLDPAEIAANAELGGIVQLWEWIGDKQVVTFSY